MIFNRIMQTVNVSIPHLGVKTRQSALEILLVREKHNHGGNRLWQNTGTLRLLLSYLSFYYSPSSLS